MNTRFVVVDHGLNTSVYKFHAHQTARLKNEFGSEGPEVFDNFEDAKQAALLIVRRYDEVSKESHKRLVWGTRGRQFESGRSDHFFSWT